MQTQPEFVSDKFPRVQTEEAFTMSRYITRADNISSVRNSYY